MTVYDVDFACAVSNACKKLNCNAKVHVKINTGMNRLGLVPETAAQKIEKIHRLYGIEIEGIFSHYATADEEDLSYSRAQFEKFKDVVGRIKALGITPPLIHISNSASILKCQDDISTAVRPGIILYGILPCDAAAGLKPVMTFYSKVAAGNTYDTDVVVSYGRKYVAHAQSKLATVCAGYADGYFRALTNVKSEIYIKGRRYKTVGTICMDMFMADISGTDDIAVGDRALSFSVNTSLRRAGAACGSSLIEILCSVRKRSRREYVF